MKNPWSRRREPKRRLLAAVTTLSLAFASAACTTPSLGELLYDTCFDSLDNDGDRKVNCEDPDCHVFEECRGTVGGIGVTGGITPVGGSVAPGTMDAGSPLGGTGGATIGPPPMMTGGSDGDGGVEPSCGPCANGEACLDGICKSIVAVTPGSFTLIITRATLPEKDIGESCYDPCGVLPLQFVACTCLPDPFVRVYRETPAGAMLVGMTSVVAESVDAAFWQDEIPLELQPGEALRFEVWDDDDPDNDDEIYRCWPDLSTPSGMISCKPPPGVGSVLSGREFSVEAVLNPR